MKVYRGGIIFILFLLILSLSSLNTGALRSAIPTNTNSNDPATWTPLDTSEYTIDAVGEKIGSLQGQSFAGWYTDTVVVDPNTGTIVVAWVRWDADSSGNDYIYVAFLKPIDADKDESPEAYRKIVKKVWSTETIDSLDSIVAGGGRILLTWTYTNSYGRKAIRAALYDTDGNYLWGGNVRFSDTYHNEWSRACYVSGADRFLIVWYTSDGDKVEGKWLYYSGGWELSYAFNIASTNDLSYTKADQMLCIGGDNKALVVFRKWDGTEGRPDLYAALVDTSNNVQEIKLYDYNGAEETVGVRGAYTNGHFIVPLLSGKYVRYDVVRESDGYVYHRDYVTSNGEHPYAIALSDRFVLAWIDHYNDDDGEPKIANIDLDDFDIHPRYGVSVTGGDSYTDKHPLIAYDSTNNKLVYVWTGKNSNGDYDIKYAIIDLKDSIETPYVESKDVIVEGNGDQKAHGFGLVSKDQYMVVYSDTSDGEEDLLAYVVLPDTESVNSIQLYELPSDGDAYKQEIVDLINDAQSEVFVAVAFFQEENPGADGTISKALVDAKGRGVDVRVIIDDDDDNQPVYDYLKNNGVPVINDSSINDATHIMHDKFMVVDSSKVIVATVNFIPDDFSKNNNTAIYIVSKAVAYFYRQEFLHMWNNGDGRFGKYKTEDHSFVAFINYNGRTIVFEGYFGPQYYGDWGRIPNTIAGYINRATSDVYFSAYIFTTGSSVTPIYNAIVNANKAGKTVRGVFDEEMNVDSPGRRLYWFIDNNVPVAIENHDYKMHAKLFVIDNKVAVLGSWNPTKMATANHDENILVIRDPDTSNGFAKQIGDYILAMYNDDAHFVRSPYQYNPKHLVISKIMFYPDTSGNPDYEWVEIYNPTDQAVDLTNYTIGDSENLIDGDDEGMYSFPSGAVIQPHGYIVIAYDASKFKETYGFSPSFEIAGNDPDVPDLIPYNTSKFTGSWNLDDNGDEVILALDQDGFLIVIDAVWYGNSEYMKTSIGQPDSGAPLDITNIDPGDGIIDKYFTGSSTYLDAIKMSDKYEIQSNPQPVPEPWIIVLVVIITAIIVILWLKKRANVF